MARTLSYTEQLVVVTCWCGIAHAIPSSLDRTASETGQAVYCPLGHQWVVTETEVKNLRKQLAAEQDAKTRLIRQRDAAQNEADAERRARKRVEKRIAKGICPCCKRTFANVARHMAGQHPTFSESVS